jgi:uncharacterized YccA/Bax inhibitor family protein
MVAAASSAAIYVNCVSGGHFLKLETRNGRARRIRFTTEVSGSGGEHGTVSTSHIASFELEGCPVQVTANRPLTVEDGDEVVVSGRAKDGVFVGIACFNRSRGVLDSQSWLPGMIIGMVLVGIGGLVAFVGASTADDLAGIAFGLMGGIFVGAIGLAIWGKSSRVRQAQELLKAAG